MNSQLLLKTLALVVLISGTSMLTECKKADNNSPENILTSKVWKRGITDKNPSTNPSGGIIYYAVKTCERDDIFKFGSNGKLTLNRSDDKCEPDESSEEILNYSLISETKKLTIDGTDYTLLEKSKNQIKYCIPIPSQTGIEYLIFLLQ